MARCWPLRLFRRNASHRPDEETSMALSDLPPRPVAGTVSEDATSTATPPHDAQAAAGAVSPTIDQPLQQRPDTPAKALRQSTQPPLLPVSVSVSHPQQPRFEPEVSQRRVSNHRRGQAQSFRVNDSWHYRNELRSLQPTQFNSSLSSRHDLPSQRHRRSYQSLLSQAPSPAQQSPSRSTTPRSHPSPLSSHPSPHASRSATQQHAQDDSPSRWSDAAVQSRYKAALTASTSPRNGGRIRPLRSSTSLRSSSSSLQVHWTADQGPPMPARAPPYPSRTTSLAVHSSALSSDVASRATPSKSAISTAHLAFNTASPYPSRAAATIPSRAATSHEVAFREGLPDPFGPPHHAHPPSSPQASSISPRAPAQPPAVPLKSALRRRPGDVPAVLPARMLVRDDDSDEMGYEGDVERGAH